MHATKWRIVLLAAFAVVVAAALLFRQMQLAGLRDTAAHLRPAVGALDALRAEHDSLASSGVPEPELERLRAGHATVERLRNHVDAVQRSLDARIRPEAMREQAAAKPLPSLLDRELARDEWRDAGRNSPAAAVETMLWAAAGGDVEHVGETLTLTSETRAKAEALLASLPEDIREGYGNADNFVAMLTAKQATMTRAAVVAEVPYPEGTILVSSFKDYYGHEQIVALSLRTAGNGWRIDVPPSAIDRYAAAIRADPRSLMLDALNVH